MGRPGRRNHEAHTDQYGETMVSQDKQQFHPGSGRGGAGGGAGGSSKRDGDLTFTRQVPKFLQAHAHLLSGGGQAADAADIDDARKFYEMNKDEEDDELELKDKEEALRQAILENPSLIDTHPELKQVGNRMKASELKEKGNTAFSAGKHDEAVKLFTECIELDRDNEVYWSNRSASYIALKKFTEAASDARKVISLKSDWVKGYARLGTALLGLNDGSEAREVLEKAMKIEPNDASIRSLLDKAIRLEAKQIETKQHTFKKRERDEPKDVGRLQKNNKELRLGEGLAQKKKQLLSFEDDEEEET